ncbi:hypothetical protein V6N12_026340 [Hibiscus sabdariffa]|uniref:Uncharacterized protein n=1 Tax=Hibiscus sabdariffa TaxID=183260 RepID=A0ABR2DT61_9ROSI
MLGRAGRLEEAEKIALEIPCERVTSKIIEIEKPYGGDYVLMSNILAGAGRFAVDAESLRTLMEGRNAIKVAGSSLS